ncbi:MAG: hypothetical protein ABIJ09_25220, partial [Pseudomonadota bacterium]
MIPSVRAATRSAIVSLLGCGLWLGASPLHARSAPVQSVWVMDLSAPDAGVETGQHLAMLLREELTTALPDHVINGVSGGCTDTDLVACARWLGAPENITLVVGGRLLQDVEGIDVELWVADNPSTGPRRSTLQRLSLSPATWRQAMRELGVRAVAPERYTGVVEIQGLQVFDRITVDGNVVEHDVPVARLDLAVGSHGIEVLRSGSGVTAEVVEVQFEQVARPVLGYTGEDGAAGNGSATAGAGSATSSEAALPWLGMGLAAGGVALVAVATGLVLHGLIALQPELSFAQQQVEANAGCIDGSDCWSQRA